MLIRLISCFLGFVTQKSGTLDNYNRTLWVEILKKLMKNPPRKRRRLSESLIMTAGNELSFLTFPSLPAEIVLTVASFLSNSDLLNLRLVCQNLDAVILSEYEICQTVTGRKECVPHKKVAYFKKCTQELQDEFKKKVGIEAKKAGDQAAYVYVARHYYKLAELYWEGIRTVPDYAQALYYYGEVYRRHGLPACLRLGLVYDEGVIVTKDKERASQLYSKYCGGFFGHHTCNNAAEAYYYLGRHFATGYQAIEEEKKKIDLLSKSASQGPLHALFKLGKAYYRADGGRKDFPRAIACIKKAGDLGHPKAYYWLARTFKKEKDTHQAIEFYKRAMPYMGLDEEGELDQTGVAYDLCKLYLKPQNLATYVGDAVDLLKQITNQHFSWSWAEYRLGKLYLKGRGVKKDTAEGIALLKKAIDNPFSVFAHNKIARMFLGIAYYKGKHIGKDDQQASQLLKFNFNSSSSFFKAFL